MPTEIEAEVRSTDAQKTVQRAVKTLLDLLEKHIKEYFYFYDSPRGRGTEVAK